MEKILLILESDVLCEALSEALINYEVCTCKADAVSATLAEFRPEALILDLFLPGTDGFTLMEDHSVLLLPAILLLPVLDSDYVRKQTAQLFVAFIFQKLCSVDYIIQHLMDMLMTNRQPDFQNQETLIANLLSKFHIHTKNRFFSIDPRHSFA